MHMVGSHVRGQKVPTAVRAMLLQGAQHDCPALLVEHVGFLEHSSALYHDALWIGFQQPASHQIVMPVHRARFVAV